MSEVQSPVQDLSLKNLSLKGFQEFNRDVYRVQNDRNYSNPQMVSRMHRYSTRVQKAVRKDDTEHLHYWLCMAFSWSLALGNRFHLDLDDEMWKRFPGICPYCKDTRCSCHKQRPAERSRDLTAAIDRPKTLRGYQQMFAVIYGHNTLRDAAEHLNEEIGEVDEAVEHYLGTHNPVLFEEIVIELVDAVTNMFAVATCMKLDLAVETEKVFKNGCPKCFDIPCKCGYTTAKTM